jgi:hypothetical protein
MPNTNDKDPKGARGGDKGNADQVGKGVQAEKGDERREYREHTGMTRKSGPHHGDRSGSESNEKK